MTRTLLHAFRFLFSASVAIALTACATNSSSGVPSAGTGAQPGVAPQAIQNDSGQYNGSMQDSVLGTGSASASLAQDSHAVGGSVAVSYGSSNVSYSFAAHTQTGLSLSGAQVAFLGSGVCTFSVTATYDANSHVLAGTYQAVRGCAGENGSFSLTEDCSFRRAGLFEAIAVPNRNTKVNPNHGIHPC
jgi:hypothetical protein